MVSPGLHVAADGDTESEALDGETAEDEGGARCSGGKEDERGHGEKEAGRHQKQSNEFHALFLLEPKIKRACGARLRGEDA
jgi:hypothetical protein